MLLSKFRCCAVTLPACRVAVCRSQHGHCSSETSCTYYTWTLSSDVDMKHVNAINECIRSVYRVRSDLSGCLTCMLDMPLAVMKCCTAEAVALCCAVGLIPTRYSSCSALQKSLNIR